MDKRQQEEQRQKKTAIKLNRILFVLLAPKKISKTKINYEQLNDLIECDTRLNVIRFEITIYFVLFCQLFSCLGSLCSETLLRHQHRHQHRLLAIRISISYLTPRVI